MVGGGNERTFVIIRKTRSYRSVLVALKIANIYEVFCEY